MFAVGMRDDQAYASGWNYSYWLTDYADYQYGMSKNHDATAGQIKFAKMNRILRPGDSLDASNYKWSARRYDQYYPWLVGLWAKVSDSSATLTIHQFRLKATYYA